MRRRNLLISFLAAATALVASASLASAEQRVFTDAAGRKVALPEKITRVMAAGPPASVLLYSVAPERMVGWVREFKDDEKEFIAAPYRDLPVHGRLTGKGDTANMEAVLAMKPDIILDVGTVNPTYASLADKVQEQTGIPYVLIDGSFANTPKSLREIGELLGEKEQAEKLAAYTEAAMQRLDKVVTDVPADQRPRVYYGRGPDGLETGLAGSINMEVLSAVGASNVAEAAGKGSLANVSLEQILSWNPDVILTLSPKFQKSVLSDPSWAGIKAVKDGRVFRAPALPFGWFDAPPGVNRAIGISWLTSALYPGKAEVDLKAETRDFYKLFYHVDLTDEQLGQLLADTGPKP
ncbi:iron ABC transporter substrate-binding protein [Aminobacter aminovorans]|uniref:iron ABC transporter substrate-binding protein n=1 Tax=Aminobacter aminovorans TaxID=83263 RepID=UPI00286041CF|nr:iron ABC transporter substrate-binding protein [Aminobacter aminovorans]MDR7225119.1 iron complex transport system substrate-binding protein [Aminobacter aminovorans]